MGLALRTRVQPGKQDGLPDGRSRRFAHPQALHPAPYIHIPKLGTGPTGAHPQDGLPDGRSRRFAAVARLPPGRPRGVLGGLVSFGGARENTLYVSLKAIAYIKQVYNEGGPTRGHLKMSMSDFLNAIKVPHLRDVGLCREGKTRANKAWPSVGFMIQILFHLCCLLYVVYCLFICVCLLLCLFMIRNVPGEVIDRHRKEGQALPSRADAEDFQQISSKGRPCYGHIPIQSRAFYVEGLVVEPSNLTSGKW